MPSGALIDWPKVYIISGAKLHFEQARYSTSESRMWTGNIENKTSSSKKSNEFSQSLNIQFVGPGIKECAY